MNWRKWKIGMVVAAATGGLTGLIGLAVGITARQAAFIVGISMGKDLLLYLTDANYRNRVLENLPSNGDTQFTTKLQQQDTVTKP